MVLALPDLLEAAADAHLIFAILLVLTLAGCGRGTVRILPRGITEVSSEIVIPAGTEDYEVRGESGGSLLKMSDSFSGRALFVCERGRRIRFRDFTIDGNRRKLEQRTGLPPSDVPFARFTRNNGILALGVDGLEVTAVNFREVAGFAILVSGGSDVRIEKVRAGNSGSRDASGKNNTTGGILLEEGVNRFQVKQSAFDNILGNAIWTHSLYRSPRDADGVIAGNRFRDVARDAIQVGHATRVVVENNSGSRIGYPAAAVDADPVGIDTAGNVDRSVYRNNRFDTINGKCIDLDGFHDGEVRGNVCIGLAHFGIVMNNNNPDMRPEGVQILDNLIQGAEYGGIFIMGSGNTISRNRLLDLNRGHRQEDLLRAGIYLGNSVVRPAPARGNTIEQNQISGSKVLCVAAAADVKLSDNRIAGNSCNPL